MNTTTYTFVMVATNITHMDTVDTDPTKIPVIFQDQAMITGYIDGDKDWPEEEGHDDVMDRLYDQFIEQAYKHWGTDWYGFKILSDIFPETEGHRFMIEKYHQAIKQKEVA
jgi:hypothetical protein